jgi:hypothetical protein
MGVPDGMHVELFPHFLVVHVHHERSDDGGIFCVGNGISDL